MGSVSGIVKQLKKEHTRLTDELHKVSAALTAFVGVYRGATPKRKGTMSAAGRKRIAAAQRTRWAKAKQTEKPKRTMSAAARKRIGDATRARWAKLRAKKKAA
jgi:hypothetical protein